MSNFSFPISAKLIGEYIGAKTFGREDLLIYKLSSIDMATEGSLVYVSDKKNSLRLSKLKDVAVITREEFVNTDYDLAFIVVNNPQLTFSKIASMFRPAFFRIGISHHAVIEKEAILGENVNIGHFAVIGKAKIGKNSSVGAHAYIGDGVRIGENVEVFPFVTILNNVEIGNNVKIYPGSVIGSEGFGLIWDNDRFIEIPQIGKVVIEDNVRIGANCTIDRATIEETRISKGTKIDDQVHIAHNCHISKNCVICGQAGLAGSVKLGENVMLGGQAGLGDGVSVGANAKIGAQAGSTTNVKGDDTYFLTPAQPMSLVTKIVRCLNKLPELFERIRKIEDKLGI